MKKKRKQTKEEKENISKETGKSFDISSISLILANLVPLFGNLFLGWDLFTILIIFWLESAVIGFYTILKMLKVPAFPIYTILKTLKVPASATIQENFSHASKNIGLIYRFLLIPFFILHYGGFMFGHLMFILVLFNPSLFTTSRSFSINLSVLSSLIKTLAITTISLFISHGISFYSNFIKKQEYKKSDISHTMTEPYKRIMIMHLTILLGGFLIFKFNFPAIAVALLVVLKICFDILAHNKEHRNKSIEPDFLKMKKGLNK